MDTHGKLSTNPLTHRIDVLTDAAHAKDITRGLLQTIFFHRTFPSVIPLSRDIPDLGLTLPAVDDVAVEQLVNDKSTLLAHQLIDQDDGSSKAIHAQLALRFHERRRKKTYNFFGLRDQDEEICWEIWVLDVSLGRGASAAEMKPLMERSVERAVEKIIETVSRHKDHIPPITTASESNPFPYDIVVAEKGAGIALPGRSL